jgi:multiple sugar transport system permease protein
MVNIEEASFVGLDNFWNLLSDPDFWIESKNTFVWCFFNLFFIVIAGVGIALFIDIDHPATAVLQRLILYPWIFPVVASALMWRLIYEPQGGILNHVLLKLGVIDQSLTYLGNPSLAMGSVILFNVWRWSPFMVIAAVAALQTIPLEAIEAARIDGANVWQRTVYIKLPQITNNILVSAFIITMWVINMFPPIWLMTEGGPGNDTTIIPVGIYKNAFHLFKTSRAAAESVLLLIITSILAAIYIKYLKKEN